MNSRILFRLTQYVTRYAPSRAKVTEYLHKKGIENPEELLAHINYNEELLIKMWIQTFIHMGKSRSEIIQKLLLKKFEKSFILQSIEPFEEQLCDWDSIKDFVSRFVHNRLSQGKSIQSLKIQLQQKYPYFRDEIAEFLAQCDDSSGLKKEIEKYLQKYDITDYGQKNKFYAALMRRGFQMGEIKNFLAERENNF